MNRAKRKKYADERKIRKDDVIIYGNRSNLAARIQGLLRLAALVGHHLSQCELYFSSDDSMSEFYDCAICGSCRRSLSNRGAFAFVIDTFALVVAQLIMAGIFFCVFLFAFDRLDLVRLTLCFLPLSFALWATYHCRDAWFRGRSLGKLLMGIRVVDSHLTNLPLFAKRSTEIYP